MADLIQLPTRPERYPLWVDPHAVDAVGIDYDDDGDEAVYVVLRGSRDAAQFYCDCQVDDVVRLINAARTKAAP